jgi:hypothetical protein
MNTAILHGVLSPSQLKKAEHLRRHGYIIGPREPRLNTAFRGRYMVAEAYDESDLPTEDARSGPRCIVGDELAPLVDQAFEWLEF